MPSNDIQLNNEIIRYDGRASQISKIWFKNLFFSLLTLGFYRFWGKTKLRQYLISCHSLGGERFVYTGTAEELFYGFFRVLPYLLPILALMIINVFFSLDLIFLVIPYVLWLSNYFLYGRLQYLTARTKWNGIHGALIGNCSQFARKNFFATIFSFGLFIPNIKIAKHAYIMKNFSFGGMQGAFDKKPHKLVTRRLLSRLMAIPSLGYSLAWYVRMRNEYLYDNTEIGGVKMTYTATTGQIYKLNLQCIFLTLFTLGLATPIVIHKRNQFNSKYLAFTGTILVDELKQHTAAADAKFEDGASILGDGFDFALG